MQLRIAKVPHFSWNFAANTTVFQLCGLIKNFEHVISEISIKLNNF